MPIKGFGSIFKKKGENRTLDLSQLFTKFVTKLIV